MNFTKKNKKLLKHNKYAYVSLFGINSLEELKLKIATEVISTKSNKDLYPILKKLSKVISDSGTGFSFSISSSIISSLILNSLENILVCLDDIERRSKDLPISEVMGLINYLVEEKNCTVLCLLNKKEVNDKNYENYKEKVFTQEFSIDESLDLVHSFFSDNDHNIIQNFYQLFGIKNIRFYKKVLSFYSDLLNKLENETLSLLSQQIILKSLLLLAAFKTMPTVMGFSLEKLKNDYSEDNWVKNQIVFDRIDENELNEEQKQEYKTKKSILQFIHHFTFDVWQKVILQFIETYELKNEINDLIRFDLFTEENLKNKEILNNIADEFYDLNLKPDFTGRLTKSLLKNLPNENYSNINFWCNMLEDMGEIEKAAKIIRKTKERIDEELMEYTGRDYLRKVYPMGKRNENDKFFNYIQKKLKNENSKPSTEQFVSYFVSLYLEEKNNLNINQLEKITKDDLREIIWANIDSLLHLNRKLFIEKIVTCSYIGKLKREELRQWAVELLQEKAKSSDPETSYVIRDFLRYTKNLKEQS